MTLRNRLTITFLALFCTALLALVLVFYRVGELPRLAFLESELNHKSAAIARLRAKLDISEDPSAMVSRTALPADETLANRLADSISEALVPPRGLKFDTKGQEKVDEAKAALRRVIDTQLQDAERVRALDRLDQSLEAVRLEYDQWSADVQGQVADAGLAVVWWAAGLCVLITAELGVFWILIRRWTIYPITSLARETQRMRGAESEVRLPVTRHDELGQLAASFNDLVARLQEHQRQLANARKQAAIGEISSGVAHGMRNPLAVIRLTAQRLEQSDTTGRNELAMLSEIIQQVDRVDARITRLLRFASSVHLRYEPVEFEWLSNAVRRESQAALRERDVALTVVDDTFGTACPIDPDLAVQAVVECVSNSAIHSPPGAEVVLRGRTTGPDNGHPREWVVSIEDRGRGIDQKVLDNIFDLFFTLREDGTGVGLSMVKKILDQHRGRIEIQSQLGHGTTIQLIWPLKIDGSSLSHREDLAAEGLLQPRTDSLRS
ncbi:MAG: HAMP domain-containing protein [Planctomycetes bacterium]|nr:HAMP domain-containing protein [Planctomycetota bacterium]